MQPVTQAAFAELKGVSAEAVRKAIVSGRLVNSLVRIHGKKKPLIDPVLAAAEWERNTDHSKGKPKPERPAVFEKPNVHRPDDPIAPGAPTLNQSKAVYEAYRARLAKLEYEEKVGKLVPKAEMEKQAFDDGRRVRDNMLNIPDRVAAEFAGITQAGVIHARLMDEIRKALEGLQGV